jgi:hypothetical protein
MIYTHPLSRNLGYAVTNLTFNRCIKYRVKGSRKSKAAKAINLHSEKEVEDEQNTTQRRRFIG